MTAIAPPAEIEHGRNHDEAAYANTLLVELSGELRRTKAAIAFARDEGARGLAALFLDPLAHEGRKHVDVAVDRPEMLAHVVAGVDEAAVTRADRIDEHQVGEVEPGVGIGNERGRGRRRDLVERRPPRPRRAELHVGRRSAGTAVEY